MFEASSRAVVVMGMGQLGGLFARAWRELGREVVPLLRGGEPRELASLRPEGTLIAVGEAALPSALADLPASLTDSAVLVQNELLPGSWPGKLINPTVAVVWFEKKGERPPHSIRPSVLHGPRAALVAEALTQLKLPFQVVPSELERDHALVVKNLYILLLNLAGLRTGGSAGELLEGAPALVTALSQELVQHQSALLGRSLELEPLMSDVRAAIQADPQHGCRGRSAEERLARVLSQARSHGLTLPTVEALAQEHLAR